MLNMFLTSMGVNDCVVYAGIEPAYKVDHCDIVLYLLAHILEEKGCGNLILLC